MKTKVELITGSDSCFEQTVYEVGGSGEELTENTVEYILDGQDYEDEQVIFIELSDNALTPYEYRGCFRCSWSAYNGTRFACYEMEGADIDICVEFLSARFGHIPAELFAREL